MSENNEYQHDQKADLMKMLYCILCALGVGCFWIALNSLLEGTLSVPAVILMIVGAIFLGLSVYYGFILPIKKKSRYNYAIRHQK